VNRNDRFAAPGKEVTSCMSHPADRSLASAMQFSLDSYETDNYPQTKSGSDRLKRQLGTSEEIGDGEQLLVLL
jgi:hypothetical protein